jgi:hypothetical protein
MEKAHMDPSVLRPILEKVHVAAGRPELGAASTREARNQFFLSFAAVMHHGHPELNPGGGDPRWMAKSAGNGRPQSDDMIAFQDGPRLRGWDLIIGAGADGFRFVDATGEGEDITGQEPILPPRTSLPPTAGPGASADRSELRGQAEPWIDLVDARHQALRLGSDDEQREWMARVTFVLAKKLNPRIGMKRADFTRPISRNTMGVGETGALEAVMLIDEATRARSWTSLGTIDHVLVAPPAFTDMGEILAATVEPIDGATGEGSVEQLKAQLLVIQDAVARALVMLP